MNSDDRRKALALTVGTGNIGDLERTLLLPMLKSIGEGEWERVVLLPSRTTEEFAQTLHDRLCGHAVEVAPLEKAGDENDADACFGHFDSVLEQLVKDFEPGDIQVDFTPGTKAMSAALVLAAVGRGVPILRYVHGERRDERGMVVPGAERVGEIRTSLATARGLLDQARTFMRRGDFGAAIELLPDLDGLFAAALFPERFHAETRSLRAAAQIYAAWDRLDYVAAAEAVASHGLEAAGAGEFAPTPEMSEWICRLSRKPPSSSHEEMAAYLRVLACDVLANAERRLRDRHFEDALLRAYRVLELVGQIRLFDRGRDSAALSPDDPEIGEFREKLRESGERGFGENRDGLTAPRELAARLLDHLGDPLAGRLLGFDGRRKKARTRNRNQSILIHGFSAAAPPEAGPLRDVLAGLAELLKEDDPGAAERLETARSLSFSGS